MPCSYCTPLVRHISVTVQVHECVSRGGKVLVPVFAVGRAQELLVLLDEYWERTNLQVGGRGSSV